MTSVCIIPARGGSKRIPRKNIKQFAGEPIIHWSIQVALKSNIFDKVLVSTDDKEIAEIAESKGALVPFIRPKKLADDYCGNNPVVCHALDFFRKQGLNINLACCLYPTAPFVNKEDLKKGIQILQEVNTDRFVFAATSFAFPIQRAISLDNKGFAHTVNKIDILKRSQDLEIMYHDAGQFYIGRPPAWYSRKDIFLNSKPLILPRWRVHDIDTMEDWKRAEIIYKTMLGVHE